MLDARVPPFSGHIGFNSHHSPMGAYFSFTCGHFGTRGGMAAQAGRPGNQDIFVGVKHGPRHRIDAPIFALPFFEGSTDRNVEAFTAGQSILQTPQPGITTYSSEQIRRCYGWATDRWITPDLEFTIYSPFGGIVDPSETHSSMSRVCLMPAVLATLTVDNSTGAETKTAFFALKFNQAGVTMLSEQRGWRGRERIGFSLGRSMGFQATIETETQDRGAAMFPFQRWSLADGLNNANAVHGLGDCAGIGLEVPPGARRTLVIALGAYLDGIVTTGIEGKYLYTRYFSGLLDVLDHALRGFDAIRAGSAELDRQLIDSKLSPDQQFLIAHGTRSYYGNTQLLDVAGEPFWIVNEGEYQMINTLDLSLDHVFWELQQNPWVVRNLLDHFVRDYSYYDEVKVPVPPDDRQETPSTRLHESGGTATVAAPTAYLQKSSPARKAFETAPGGISFCHDMGVANAFSPRGTSSYELPDLTGCFSFMTQEQLCNWILMAASYVAKTGDRKWLTRSRDVVMACFRSMLNRESGNAATETGGNGNSGSTIFDSARCGSGSEITTYDSLDESLGQARDNLYIAVKRVAAYLGLEFMLSRLGESGGEEAAASAARHGAEAISARRDAETGLIPAIFDPASPGHHSRILPAVEAMIFPWFWGTCEHGSEHKPSQNWLGAGPDSFVAKLKQHTLALLRDPQRRNYFADGGLKLSSTSNNSWMSKIAVFQHVARRMLRIDDDPELTAAFARADAAHVKWQTEGSSFWACCDHIINGKGEASKYYPRCITTALWMDKGR